MAVTKLVVASVSIFKRQNLCCSIRCCISVLSNIAYSITVRELDQMSVQLQNIFEKYSENMTLILKTLADVDVQMPVIYTCLENVDSDKVTMIVDLYRHFITYVWFIFTNFARYHNKK